MNETTKESKFLDAINKYAEKQKSIISAEVEEYKAQKIEQATEAGLKDAYELIQHDITQRKSAIVTEYAQKEYSLRRELYAERQRITDKVFKSAEKKLKEYTSTNSYHTDILKSLREAREYCDDSPCVIRVRESDLAVRNDIKSVFPDAEIKTDESILIGGFKLLCEAKEILIDCTLDARLDRERLLFTQRSGLKVV